MSKPEPSAARFRSQAVAQLVDMPVATLRVWERRYGLGCAGRSPAGHRLYTAEDVQRIALMKQLTRQGHAIGTLTDLPLAQLLALQQARQPLPASSSPYATPATIAPTDPAPSRPWRLVVVGSALAQRLRRLHLPGGWQLLGPFEQAEQALHAAQQAQAQPLGRLASALADRAPPAAPPVDWLLALHPLLPGPPDPALQAAAQAWGATRVGVVYGYGHPAARQAHAQAGIPLLRDGSDDAAWVDWLTQGQTAPGHPHHTTPGDASAAAAAAPDAPPALPPPPRFDELTLSALAAEPARLSCECPRHVADLLLQLSRFEAYSAQCAHRDTADAALHAELGRRAGHARVLMEQALQALAHHEGLALPGAG
ncbi:MerR family transcriptional regulator [Ideonella livida]|uniref:MerR family transcriptional regulator n=1 Tax=Ideonella livida TaxID=2707176 RepID=A0A7C9PID8_9BURK|nr:MerR family transcriptional regulator [Ideonella livida]NDY92696.1 MerR family transcriptional regulator [Ideonella livida]